MEVTGKVVQVLAVESGTSKMGNAWQKQNFVIETLGRYPKKICFQLFGENVSVCPAIGDEVKVLFDAESREYNGRWYTQLNAWEVEKQGAQPAQAQTQQYQQVQQPQAVQVQQARPQREDDLPF